MKGICHISFEDYLWDANGNINRIVEPRRPNTRALYFNDEGQPLRKFYSSDGSGPSLLGPKNKYCY